MTEYPVYHFTCGCSVPTDKVYHSHYFPETKRIINRTMCPEHPDARLTEKTIKCGRCGALFNVASMVNNVRYCNDCKPITRGLLNTVWKKSHKPVEVQKSKVEKRAEQTEISWENCMAYADCGPHLTAFRVGFTVSEIMSFRGLTI